MLRLIATDLAKSSSELSGHWWTGLVQCQFWGMLLPLYSVLHCLTTSTFLLALLLFSWTDKQGLTWFQSEGWVLILVRCSCVSWGYTLTTTRWSFIPHEHSHHSCLGCALDIAYSVLEMLGRRVVSHFSPKKVCGIHTRIGMSCSHHWYVSELSRLWQQHGKGGHW